MTPDTDCQRVRKWRAWQSGSWPMSFASFVDEMLVDGAANNAVVDEAILMPDQIPRYLKLLFPVLWAMKFMPESAICMQLDAERPAFARSCAASRS